VSGIAATEGAGRKHLNPEADLAPSASGRSFSLRGAPVVELRSHPCPSAQLLGNLAAQTEAEREVIKSKRRFLL
jgi:hypothetical protein